MSNIVSRGQALFFRYCASATNKKGQGVPKSWRASQACRRVACAIPEKVWPVSIVQRNMADGWGRFGLLCAEERTSPTYYSRFSIDHCWPSYVRPCEFKRWFEWWLFVILEEVGRAMGTAYPKRWCHPLSLGKKPLCTWSFLVLPGGLAKDKVRSSFIKCVWKARGTPRINVVNYLIWPKRGS